MSRGFARGVAPAAATTWAVVAALLFLAERPAEAAADPPPPLPLPARAPAAGRSLGDIHIEGEIAVPQVLFITARDQRRFMEFQHRRYLRTSLEIGEQTILPSRIAVIRTLPADVRKETQR